MHTYVDAWRTADLKRVLDTLATDCVIIESHGPTYRGTDQVRRWIESWFAAGGTIDRWDITSTVAAKESCTIEWLFKCTVDDVSSSFEGASIAHCRGGRIAHLREYRMTESQHEWDG